MRKIAGIALTVIVGLISLLVTAILVFGFREELKSFFVPPYARPTATADLSNPQALISTPVDMLFTRSQSTGRVHDLLIDPQDHVYVAGVFAIGNELTHSGAMWDGSAWQDLFGETESGYPDRLNDEGYGFIHLLARDSRGNIYAAGPFTRIGGIEARQVAMWDGQRWHALGSGLSNLQSEGIQAMVVGSDDRLYVAGRFSTAEQGFTKGGAFWDGARWWTMNNPPGIEVQGLHIGPDGQPRGSGSYDDRGKYIFGDFRWNGQRWDLLPKEESTRIYLQNPDGRWVDVSIAFANWHPDLNATPSPAAVALDGAIFAKQKVNDGQDLILRWTGKAWKEIGLFMKLGSDFVFVDKVQADHAGNLYVTGSFNNVNGQPCSNIARWDGEGWSCFNTELGLGEKSAQVLALDDQGGLVVGGAFTHAGGVSLNGIGRWNGQSWQPYGGGIPSGVKALAAAPGGVVYASTTAWPNDRQTHYVLRWDGQAWNTILEEAEALELRTDRDGNLFGLFADIKNVNNNQNVQSVRRWDGRSWTRLGPAFERQMNWPIAVGHLALDGQGRPLVTVCRAEGGSAYENQVCGVRRWDGQDWQTLGTEFPRGSTPNLFAAAGDWIAVLLSETCTERFNCASAWEWDGQRWAKLTGNHSIRSLTLDPQGRVYAFGFMDQWIDGHPEMGIWRWTGLNWQLMIRGLSGSLGEMLITPDGKLYAAAGHDFRWGAFDVGGLAVWNLK